LDGNHPLSGIALRLNLTIESVREATSEEIKAGSAGTGFFKIHALPESTSDPRTLH
jgi:FKBP-type peptidyl-prolyl cis-trans isomerase SlyD